MCGTTRAVTPEIEAFAKQKGLHLAAEYDGMLHHAGVDAVVLATPHSMHATQVMAAAAAGKHVYCEKPFTLSKHQAENASPLKTMMARPNLRPSRRNRARLLIGRDR